MVQFRISAQTVNSSRTKLLVCLPYLTPAIGGGAMVLLNLLEPLADQSFDIHAVYFQERAKGLIPKRLAAHGLIKHVGKARYYFEYPRIILALARLLKREKPDAIVCNSYQTLGLSLAAKALSRSRAAVIAGEQNNLTLMFRGAKWGRLRAFFIKLLDPRADAIIVPARGLREHLVRDFDIPEKKIAVIPNPVASGHITAAMHESIAHPWFERHDRPILLNAGVLDAQKNQKLLLRAFAQVRKNLPSRCVILGEGPLRGELEAQAKTLGVAEEVAFLGFQDNPFKFMAKADAFVLSSDYEGFGIVLAEALACGCPVVSTDCDYGPKEVVEEGKTGLLVPVNDEAALAQAILRALSDQDLRRRLIDNGRRRARDFSQDTVAKRYAEAIRSVLPGSLE